MRLGVWCLGRSKRGVGQSTDEQNMRRCRRDRTARVAVRRFFSGAKGAGGCPPSLRDHNPAGRACVRSIESVRCATTIPHAVSKSSRQRNGKVCDRAMGQAMEQVQRAPSSQQGGRGLGRIGRAGRGFDQRAFVPSGARRSNPSWVAAIRRDPTRLVNRGGHRYRSGARRVALRPLSRACAVRSRHDTT